MSCDVGKATEGLENEFDVGEVTERLENENSSFASSTSQALHLRHLASRPCNRTFLFNEGLYIYNFF